MLTDYFKTYFEYAGVGRSEAPTIFHRWTSLSIIGTLLGRQIHFPFGHNMIYPNQYIMFMGSPGTRKSTAVSIGTGLLKAVGYTRLAGDRTSKERFLIDLAALDDVDELDDLENLVVDGPSERCIAADEFTDFVGAGNMDFITLLTRLWDNLPQYEQPKIHGKSVFVSQPTVNILSGNTPQNFAVAFPPEALGTGFLSRLLLVHGEVNGKKVAFPEPPAPYIKELLVDHLKEIKIKCDGEISISSDIRLLCKRVYEEFVDIEDHRFKHYSTRRFTHFLKLCMILASADLRLEIREEDVLRANTLLHYTELRMPKALGEFGKSKYSDVTQRILEILDQAHTPVTMTELWKKVCKDLNRMSDLTDIVKNLQQAEQIQSVTTKSKACGFLPLKRIKHEWAKDLIDESWLSLEEKF